MELYDPKNLVRMPTCYKYPENPLVLTFFYKQKPLLPGH